MAFLFGRSRTKSTQELVRSTKELMLKLIAEEKVSPKVRAPGHVEVERDER